LLEFVDFQGRLSQHPGGCGKFGQNVIAEVKISGVPNIAILSNA